MTARTGTESAAHGNRVIPVFFDESGKRWHRIIVGAGLVFFPAMAIIAVLTVSALRPVWAVPEHSYSGYPAQLLSESKTHTMPVIGDEGTAALVRVDLVQHRNGMTYLTDPFSGQVIRAATAGEVSAIGTHSYVLEWYGHPAAHQLVLTFDDGPDPQNTPKILDILSHEHVPATFFAVGQNVARNPGIVTREIRGGHVVGNHTFTHVDAGHGRAPAKSIIV